MNFFLEPNIFTSNSDGPTIALVAITHGNEPVGLSIFERLIQEGIFNGIKSGRVMLVCSNIGAHEQYLKQSDPLKLRYIDHDMNRIWNDDFIEGSYEYRRRETLKGILGNADIILDIHSVSKGDDVLGITGQYGLKDAMKFMDVDKILMEGNDAPSMRSWLERTGKCSYGIEAGNHVSENGRNNGFRIIQNMLIHFGIIEGDLQFQFPPPEILEFIEELIPTFPEFQYAREFNNWEPIPKGEIYAFDGKNNPLTHDFDGDIRIGLVQKKIQFGRGAGFFFRKMGS